MRRTEQLRSHDRAEYNNFRLRGTSFGQRVAQISQLLRRATDQYVRHFVRSTAQPSLSPVITAFECSWSFFLTLKLQALQIIDKCFYRQVSTQFVGLLQYMFYFLTLEVLHLHDRERRYFCLLIRILALWDSSSCFEVIILWSSSWVFYNPFCNEFLRKFSCYYFRMVSVLFPSKQFTTDDQSSRSSFRDFVISGS